MSFAPAYNERYDNVIAPAVRSLTVENKRLEPYRVDISKSGDSILTDISDGIAHARLVLADVSSIGKDSITSEPYRNANVMYEVGMALACRSPNEVLLIRDDHDDFLFDVSSIPYANLNFADPSEAVPELARHLSARLREQNFFRDARVKMAIASLSAEEVIFMKQPRKAGSVWGNKVKMLASWYALATSRLLDKGLIKLAGEFPEDMPAFTFSPLGHVVHRLVSRGLRQFEDNTPQPQASPEVDEEIPPSAPENSS